MWSSKNINILPCTFTNCTLAKTIFLSLSPLGFFHFFFIISYSNIQDLSDDVFVPNSQFYSQYATPPMNPTSPITPTSNTTTQIFQIQSVINPSPHHLWSTFHLPISTATNNWPIINANMSANFQQNTHAPYNINPWFGYYHIMHQVVTQDDGALK